MCSRPCCSSRSMCALCSLTQLSATLPAALLASPALDRLQVATVYLQTVPQQLANPQLASRSPPSASPKHRGSPLHSAMNPRTACAAGSTSSIRTCDGPQPLLVPPLSLLLVTQGQLRAPGLAQAVPQDDRMCSRPCCCSRSMCALCSLTQLSATLPAAACDAPKSCRPSSYARSTTLAESAPV